MQQDLSPTEIDAIVKSLGNSFVEPVASQRPGMGDTVERSSAATVSRVQFSRLEESPDPQGSAAEAVRSIPVNVEVVIGSAKLTLEELLALQTGSIIALDKLAGEPADIEVNGKKIASGEVVVVDDRFAVRITAPTNA